MPFLMDVDRASRIMVDGLAENRGRIAFPWRLRALTWLLAALPDRVAGRIGGGLPKK